MEPVKYNLIIGGFTSEAQMRAFYEWYEGQGEQDSAFWFECGKEKGEIDVNSMITNMKVKPQKYENYDVDSGITKVFYFEVKPE